MEITKEELYSQFLDYVKKDVEQMKKSLNYMSEENEQLKKKVENMEKRQRLSEGLITKLKTQIEQQQDAIVDLKCRSMRDNVVVNGIKEDPNETWEKTKEKVEKFFKKELKIGEDLSIDRAHRMANARSPGQLLLNYR